jgi:DNA-binding transcriptional MerR regulator
MAITAADRKKLLRISEVSMATGVSLPTIHYYVHEGLVSPAVKTARNMAYYSPGCVEDILLIKELQTKKYLPLSVIKVLLQAKQQGEDVEHIVEMRSLFEDVFHPVMPGGPENLKFQELVNASGLSAATINKFESIGLLMPAGTGEGKRYDDIDLCIARNAGELLEYGLTFSDLGVYLKYVNVIRDEFDTIHSRMHQIPNPDRIPLSRMVNTIGNLKECLSRKVWRQTALEQRK